MNRRARRAQQVAVELLELSPGDTVFCLEGDAADVAALEAWVGPGGPIAVISLPHAGLDRPRTRAARSGVVSGRFVTAAVELPPSLIAEGALVCRDAHADQIRDLAARLSVSATVSCYACGGVGRRLIRRRARDECFALGECFAEARLHTTSVG